MDLLEKFDPEEIENIPDIGEKTVQGLKEFFKSKKRSKDLRSLPLKFEKEILNENQKLKGFSFVITGRFELSRDLIKNKIEKEGGKVMGSVSPKTNFVICGENPGNKKDKALKLKVPLISWGDFLEKF